MTGSPAGAAFLAPPEAAPGLALWGSSSMASGLGHEGTPLPIRFHEQLGAAFWPAPVESFALGGTTSWHTALQRAVLTPLATPEAEGPGPVVVALDPYLPPRPGLEIPGSIGPVAGTLDCALGAFRFTPADPAAIVQEGTFTSSLGVRTRTWRHVVWTGKNNILETDTVLEHIRALRAAVAGPTGDTLVLGPWATPADGTGSARGEAMAALREALAAECGDRFLDVGAALRDPASLAIAPLAAAGIPEDPGTRSALADATTPPLLVGSDGTHLNGWGNLLVLDALQRRMQEVGWL